MTREEKQLNGLVEIPTPPKAWGYELMIDAKAGDLEKVRSGDNIKQFAKDVVDAIGMVRYGEPWAECFADEEDKKGHTLFQPIMTSSVTGHFVDSNGDFYINIFSCREIDVGPALEVVQKFFSPSQMEVSYVVRGRQ